MLSILVALSATVGLSQGSLFQDLVFLQWDTDVQKSCSLREAEYLKLVIPNMGHDKVLVGSEKLWWISKKFFCVKLSIWRFFSKKRPSL